ncbi:hypothetical protein [Pseudidiomarina aquimaris]|uniref:hypothetical protein n=1 Tax=Pseudidiomarina aquimaris TaxID=641841 RepID=UPI003A96B536
MSYQNTKKMTFRLAIFTTLWLLSTAAATFTASAYQDDNSVLKISLILVNLIFGGLMIEANRRYILALDELQRRIHLQAMGITLGVTVIAGLAYSIADIGNLIATDAEFSHLLILMSLTYLLSLIIANRRYQ